MTTEHVISEVVEYYMAKLGVSLNIFLKMNFQTSKCFEAIKVIPQFYQDIFLNFNKCKDLEQFSQLQNHEALTQIIWGNEYFKHNGKTLYYRHWIKSGFIYVKDLFNDDGSWINENDILEKLKNTSNWIIEFSILKRVLGLALQRVETKLVKYIQKQTEKKIMFLDHDINSNPKYLEAKTIYQLLVKKTNKDHTQKNIGKVSLI